jgi:phage tail-like protein
MSETTTDPAVSMCFSVKLDKEHQLGTFTGCEGLGAEIVLEQREQGGNNTYVHQLPTRLKYPTVKLTRALNSDTLYIARWFASLATGITPVTAEIRALTVYGDPIWTWILREVVPVRWQGPSFTVDSAKPATETLELAHHGFLACG